jgi:peptidoglycan/LPS O-acetylase OafA/YrhL
MKRTLVLILAALATVAVFAGLVHVVLVATHLSESAATTVQGLTNRRLWATTAGLLALISVVSGGIALAHSADRFGTAGRVGVIVALAAGLIAVINGAFVLAVANGGPGSGNGVVGGAAALLLGLIGMIIGGLGLGRSRRRTAARNGTN